MNESQNWEKIIRPKGKLFDLKFKEIWSYRDLIILFVKREFISKYKQTILGPLWAVIQPLLTTVVFTIIFGNLANLTTADTNQTGNTILPSFLFYMTGTIIWTYFSSTVSITSNTFIGNMAIMGKVYYPRMVTPISASLSNLISFFIQLAIFIAIWIVYWLSGSVSMVPSCYLALVPLLIIQMVLLSMGTGIIISALTTKYRDLAMLVAFGLQLWQYASPIAYGLTLIPEKYLGLYLMNPVTPIITTFRFAFFGVGYFNPLYYGLSWGMTVVIFLLGLILFNRIEKNFVDMI